MQPNLPNVTGQISDKKYVEEIIKDILDQIVSIVVEPKCADINNSFFSRNSNSGTPIADTEYKLMNQMDFTDRLTNRKLFSIKISGKVN